MLPVKRLAVGVVAVVASILPVAEIGLFGYETFLSEEEADDQRNESFQDLLAFQAQIDLHATKASLLPDGPSKHEAYNRTDRAIDLWEDAFRKWRMGDYESMFFTAQSGRQQLMGAQGDQLPQASPDVPRWAREAVEAPSFPWLIVGLSAAVALVAWGVFLSVRSRRRRRDGPGR